MTRYIQRWLAAIAISYSFTVVAQDISSATVKATGTSTQRIEADRWADMVNIKDFGASNSGDPSTNSDAINNAFNLSPIVHIPAGKFICSKDITIPVGCSIEGQGTITLSGARIILSSNSQIKDITINGNNKDNINPLISSSWTENILIDNVKLFDARLNAIEFSHVTNAEINNCKINNCGSDDLSNSEITYLGNGIYLGGCSLIRIAGNSISEVYGFGAINFVDTNKITIINNYIFKTKYRGMLGIGNGTIGEIFISTNRLERIGELNNTGSAVSCNGIAIFSDMMETYSCTIKNNYLNAIAENGIEVSSGGDISENTIINTGYKSNLTTTSNEGIFVGPRSRVINNNIYMTRGSSIRVFINNDTGIFNTVLPVVSESIEIRNNLCKVPGNQYCVSVWVDGKLNGQKRRIERLSVVGNELYSGTIQITATNGAEFDPLSCKILTNSTYTGLLPDINSTITFIKDNSFNR